MPATAGRVRMPANNRVHSSAALQTHGIWQSAIGYDPYAPNKDEDKNNSQSKSSNSDLEANNAYASFQGLLALARSTGSNADEARGACKKCGRVGHLSFQCRNFLSIKDDRKERDPEAIEAAALSEINKLKGNGKYGLENGGESEEESETSDSEEDSEIERIIASRYGKMKSVKLTSDRKKRGVVVESDESESDEGRERSRGRSKKKTKKRRSRDSDDDRSGKRIKEKRKRADSSEEEREKRHRKRKSEDEKKRNHKSKHKETERRRKVHSDSTDAEDSRVGRTLKRQGRTTKRRHHHED